MEPAELYAEITRHPRFGELVSRRARLAWTSVIVTLLSYYCLISLVVFRPDWLRRIVWGDSVINAGLIIAVAVMLFVWSITRFYVVRARALDRLRDQILEGTAE